MSRAILVHPNTTWLSEKWRRKFNCVYLFSVKCSSEDSAGRRPQVNNQRPYTLSKRYFVLDAQYDYVLAAASIMEPDSTNEMPVVY